MQGGGGYEGEGGSHKIHQFCRGPVYKIQMKRGVRWGPKIGNFLSVYGPRGKTRGEIFYEPREPARSRPLSNPGYGHCNSISRADQTAAAEEGR